MVVDTVGIEIKKRDQRAGQRDAGMAGGRTERGNHAHEITQEHKDGHRAGHGQETPPIVADIVVQQVADAEFNGIGEQEFADLLGAAGTLGRQSGLEPQDEHHRREHDQQCCSEIIGQRVLRIHAHTEHAEHCRHGMSEPAIQQLREEALVFHPSARLPKNFVDTGHHGRSAQREQATQNAYRGNCQTRNTNIHHQSNQRVASEELDVNPR